MPQIVADWSQAEIGYTFSAPTRMILRVADWSQAEIGYTPDESLAASRQLRIGHRLRLVTLT